MILSVIKKHTNLLFLFIVFVSFPFSLFGDDLEKKFSGHPQQELQWCIENNYEGITETEVDIYINDIKSLPDTVVFLSGQYTDRMSAKCNMILVSRDAGKTWEHTGPVMASHKTVSLRTSGRDNIWAVLIFTTEGVNCPEYLIRSNDAGRSWKITPLDFLEVDQPLFWISSLEFFDSRNGIMITDGTLKKKRVYVTADSGRTWKKVVDASDTPPADYDMEDYGANRRGESGYPSAALWKEIRYEEDGEYSYYKINAYLRLRRDHSVLDSPYIIEMNELSYNDEEDRWQEVSRIPFNYMLENGKLTPIPSENEKE